jgi:cytochrome c oxidase subunit 3
MSHPGHSGAQREHAHPPWLQHHFDTPLQQYDSGKLGMWLFLATEILLFGGLFCAYAVYRGLHPEIFVWAHVFLDTKLGAINTVILLCSSLTMAWAVRAAQLDQRKLLVLLLALTLLGGAGFMGIKYVEYKAKFEHGLLWASRFSPEEHGGGHAGTPGEHAGSSAEHAAPSEEQEEPDEPPAKSFPERSTIAPAGRAPGGLAGPAGPESVDQPTQAEPRNVQVFFSIYFLMTGLHGLHVLAGMGAIAWILFRATRGAFSRQYFTPVDLVGLYWHLVDLIWIFLFPLLYLID